MKLLLDTCTFLWMVGDPASLSPVVRRHVVDPSNEVYVSAVSAWEIAVKWGLGRLRLSARPDQFVPAQREAHGIGLLPLDEASALHVTRLPSIHHDPFDRMLVSQAIVHGLVIATPDATIGQYPARTVW